MTHITSNSAYQILSAIYAGLTIDYTEFPHIVWKGEDNQVTNAHAQEMHFEEVGSYHPGLMS